MPVEAPFRGFTAELPRATGPSGKRHVPVSRVMASKPGSLDSAAGPSTNAQVIDVYPTDALPECRLAPGLLRVLRVVTHGVAPVRFPS
jgi:hypothetical protein